MSEAPPLPDPESPFWDSPALRARTRLYPERFGGLIPMRIRMLKTVRPDPLALLCKAYRGRILVQGHVYDAWTNSYGAVAGIGDDGRTLGVKPDEFEVTEWFTPATK